MDLMDTAQLLGNFGEFAGSLGVLASLVYLGLQIRSNTRVARADSETQFQIYWNSHVVNNWTADTSRASLFRKGLCQLNLLTRDERVVFAGFLTDSIDAQRVALRLHKNGQIDGDLLGQVNDSVGAILKSPGAHECWNEVKTYFMHRDLVDQLIERDDLMPLSENPLWQYHPEEDAG